MAVTDDYPRIIDDNQKMTRPMHNLYTYFDFISHVHVFQ